jgi:molybdenum cofactor synthesis domain-containing protein
MRLILNPEGPSLNNQSLNYLRIKGRVKLKVMTESSSSSLSPYSSKIVYVDLEETWKTLFANMRVRQEATEVMETISSFGRVVAEDVVSKTQLPPHNSSHLDGYACDSEDLRDLGPQNWRELEVAGKVQLGRIPSFGVKRGEAARILTGSYLPKGTNCVLGVEDVVEIEKGSTIRTRTSLKKWENVYRAGVDIRKNSVAIPRGSVLRAQDISLLATLRIGSVKVVKKPLVGILSTGSELVDPFSGNEEGIPETHSLLLKQMAISAGATATDYGIVEDKLDVLKEKLRRILSASDVVLIIGGSSVGEADLVSTAINEIGQPGVLVHGIKLDPGRVSGFGVVDGKPIVICPGLVQSTLNAFIVFAIPILKSLQGFEPLPKQGIIKAEMSEERVFRKRFASFAKLTYVNLTPKNGVVYAKPVVGETPMVSVLSKANAYVMTEPNKEMLSKGEIVDARLLPGFSEDVVLKN